MSQAISLMPALNGYGNVTEASSLNASDAIDNATETFIANGLAKVLKINNICSENFSDCGIVTSFTNIADEKISVPTTLYELNGFYSSMAYCNSSYSTLNTKAVAFETQNIFNTAGSERIWSSSVFNSESAWNIYPSESVLRINPKNSAAGVRCIKR